LKAVLLRWFVQGIQKIYPHIDDRHRCHYCYCIIYFSAAASFHLEEKPFYSIAPLPCCRKWSEDDSWSGFQNPLSLSMKVY